MEIGLLVLRLVVGLAFAAHGAQKLFGAFGGAGIDGTGAFFEQVGLRPGRLHAVAAGVCELAGGALIAVGLLTPFAAAALIAVMTAAVLTVHAHNGFFVANNGFEYTSRSRRPSSHWPASAPATGRSTTRSASIS
jgi:putative oxidoreductase